MSESICLNDQWELWYYGAGLDEKKHKEGYYYVIRKRFWEDIEGED